MRLSGRMWYLVLQSGKLEWGALWEKRRSLVLSVWCVLGQWSSEVFLQEKETSTIRQGVHSRRCGANVAVAGELCGRHPHRDDSSE